MIFTKWESLSPLQIISSPKCKSVCFCQYKLLYLYSVWPVNTYILEASNKLDAACVQLLHFWIQCFPITWSVNGDEEWNTVWTSCSWLVKICFPIKTQIKYSSISCSTSSTVEWIQGSSSSCFTS